MKGYKALGQDMRASLGNGMQFELGRIYTVNGEVIPCENGFHFCKKIEELNCYYNIASSRIFEVEADGVIRQHGNKYVAERIKLVRELSKEDVGQYFEQNLQFFVYDEDWCVREAVAKQEYGLDILINDKNWYVRQAVANQGYGLDVLINDKDWQVREAVVRQGYGLDGLVKDKEHYASRTAKNMSNKNYQKKKLKSILSRMYNRLSVMIEYMSDK